MPLQPQEVSVSFTEGVDTKTDDKISTKLDVLENGFIGQNGTIKKRNGFDELSDAIYLPSAYTGNNLSKGELLVTNNDQLLSVSSDYAMIYNGSLGNKWVSEFGGGTPYRQYQLTGKTFRYSRLSGNPISLFREETTTQEIYVSNYADFNFGYTSGTFAIARKDKTTGIISEESAVSTGAWPYNNGQMVSVGGAIIFAYKTSNTIFASDISTTSNGTYTTLASDASIVGDAGQYNIFSINGFLFLVYVTTFNTISTVKIKKFDSSLTLLASTSFTSTDIVSYGFAMERNPVADTYTLFYNTNVSSTQRLFAKTYNSGLTSSTSLSISTTSETNGSYGMSACYSTSGLCIVLFAENVYGGSRAISTYRLTNAGSFSSSEVVTNAKLVSGAFYKDQICYAVIAKETNVSGTYVNVLVDEFLDYISNASDIASTQSGYDVAYGKPLNDVIPISGTKYGSLLATIVSSNYVCSSPREIINKGIFSTGGMYEFSSGRIYEPFFVHAPKILSASQGAGSVPVGTYNYIAVYEFLDSNGQLTESLASDPFQVIVVTSAKQITFDISLALTRRTQYRIALYRKLSTDSVYNFVSYEPVDNSSIVTLNKTLYTTGSALQNTPAPLTNIFTMHADRMFCIDEENKNNIFFTRKTRPGYGLQFNTTVNYITCNDNKTGFGETCTGLGSLDDKLIIFKNNSLYAVFGDGPNGLGQGTFSDPKLISTDVGCRDPRSIVNTSDGIMFMSNKGIYILTRSLEVVYIGADVEAFNGDEITSAILLPTINQVRFTTRSDVALVYNYFYKQWSWFTNYNAQHAVIWKGVYTHQKSTGKVRTESTSFLDITTPITIRITLGWIKLGGLQHFQRIWRLILLGTYKSTHNVVVNVSYDFEDYVWDTYTIAPLSSDYNRTIKPTNTELYNGANDGVYDYEIHLKKQKCAAFKVEIYDTTQTGESYSLTGMSMLVGIKSGLDKISGNKKF